MLPATVLGSFVALLLWLAGMKFTEAGSATGGASGALLRRLGSLRSDAIAWRSDSESLAETQIEQAGYHPSIQLSIGGESDDGGQPQIVAIVKHLEQLLLRC